MTCRIHGPACSTPWGYDEAHTDQRHPYTIEQLAAPGRAAPHRFAYDSRGVRRGLLPVARLPPRRPPQPGRGGRPVGAHRGTHPRCIAAGHRRCVASRGSSGGVMTKALAYNATMGALFTTAATVGGAATALPAMSVALFAVAAALHLGLAAVILTINHCAAERAVAAPPVRVHHPSVDDLAARARRDIRRAAMVPTAPRAYRSPEWPVRPYADPANCWGCGLDADAPPRQGWPLMCLCCQELYDNAPLINLPVADQANQRREQERGWPGAGPRGGVSARP